jgi:hypothetical protein
MSPSPGKFALLRAAMSRLLDLDTGRTGYRSGYGRSASGDHIGTRSVNRHGHSRKRTVARDVGKILLTRDVVRLAADLAFSSKSIVISTGLFE